MNARSMRLALAVLGGILIGVILEALVERAVPAQPWRALAYVVLTVAVFVLVLRSSARDRA